MKGTMHMVIQVIGKTPETDVKQWLNYLGLILPSKEQEERDKGLKEVIRDIILHTIEKLEDIWNSEDKKKRDILKMLENQGTLTVDQIKEIRKEIDLIVNEAEKRELYLKLQEKVPYHNQRNNNQLQKVADVMCNLTSQAMCLEYLGIKCPDPNMQFEDYLEKIRIENGYGKRTIRETRKKIAENFNVCQYYKDFYGKFNKNKQQFTEYILNYLQSGCGVMLSIWPETKGHLVIVQGITEKGIVVDDPYGMVKDFKPREEGKTGGYDLNSTEEENSKGEDNLWKWEEIEDITVKYVEVYCNCEIGNNNINK